MMKVVNGWSSIFLIIAILLSGEIFKFVEFANKFPVVYYNIVALSVMSAIGQLFLYSMVSKLFLYLYFFQLYFLGIRIWAFSCINCNNYS